MSSNDDVGISISQPKNFKDRRSVAGQCGTRLKITMPLLVDDLKDTVGNLYSAMPDRLYLIDSRGRVTYKSGRGPFGFFPGELEQSLILLLKEESKPKGVRR